MRPQLFNWERIGRAGAVVLVTAAILGSAISIHLSGRRAQAAAPVPVARVATAGLDRCRSLGTAAADDARCQAVWAELRRRFFATSAPPERAP